VLKARLLMSRTPIRQRSRAHAQPGQTIMCAARIRVTVLPARRGMPAAALFPYDHVLSPILGIS